MVKNIPLASGGITLISTCAAVSVVATIWTILRCYARQIKGVGLQLEDCIIIAALAMLYCETAFIIAMTIKGGIGHHARDVDPANLMMMFKLSYGMQIFYALGLSMVKCSLCITLARIFRIPRYVIAARIALGLSIAWGCAVILNSLLVCKPISMFWDPTTPGGRCGNQNAAFAAVGALDVAIDVFIFIIPLPRVVKLQVPLPNKVAILCIFTLGIFTILVGAFRTVTIVRLDFLDSTYTGMVPDLLTALELGIAIIVASSTVLRPVFDKLFHALREATRTTTRSTIDEPDQLNQSISVSRRISDTSMKAGLV